LKKIARKVEVKEPPKDLLLQVRVPVKYVHAMMMGGLLDVLANCEISIMHHEIKVAPPVVLEEPFFEEPDVEEPKIEEPPVFQKTVPRKVRKVIQFRCPECGGMNKRMVFRNEGTYDTVCSHCKAKYSFWDSDLEKTEYNCPNCDELNFYFSPKDVRFDFENDSCRSCGTKHSVYEILELSEVQQLMAHDYTTADGKSAFKVV
jgi:DNA-directed RNA polymerase subunit RPC12/RpoP